VNNGGLVYLIF